MSQLNAHYRAIPISSGQSRGGLGPEHFVRIASHGFGDAENSYAFSMDWYRGRLYVGTVRNMLALIKASPPRHPAAMKPWPVKTPRDVFTLDLRSQVWRYSPDVHRWSRVFVSPLVTGLNGEPTPRDIGYRHMTVFRGPEDVGPALYVATAASNTRGLGAHILRYTEPDGMVPFTRPGLGDQNVSTFRMLVDFKGRLYTSPVGSGRAWNAADRPTILQNDGRTFGPWRPVSEPHFGDRSNDAFYSMAVFADHLYVGTLNPNSGYQIWKTRGDGRPPYRWIRVLDRGAGRGNLNEAAVSMHVFNDALYIGSGISNGGYNRTHLIGPAAGEIIRIYPDDTWDLVAGTPRETPDGQKYPLSGLGPGFDNPCAGYIWSMTAHEGWLYAGTFDSAVFALWADSEIQPPARRRLLERVDPNELVRRRGGCELWRTHDGMHWLPVTRTGFGNPYNYGVRTMASTPIGLFVGTANPFGPEVATKLAAGWEYVPNPRGGCEVWLGSTSWRPHLASGNGSDSVNGQSGSARQ
jgi:hypothetical protein